jgi:hypothetical protein
VDLRDLQPSADVAAAAWIGPQLAGEFGAVTLQVPNGYEAYARICHPTSGDANPATWSEVAQMTGRRTHALMQWHALVGSSDPLNARGSIWPGARPPHGNLVPEVLSPLCDVLDSHTDSAGRCWFCLWDGWGWIDEAFSRVDLSRPRVELPHREYLLFAGPLHAALDLTRSHGRWRQSPNLFWPEDRAWCVATEIDFDSTLVGGSAQLIADILAAPPLESWAVKPDDSLAFDADTINLVE